MTSVLNVDTIADKAGTGPVGLTKQIAAKAWIHHNDGASTYGSFGSSSLTDNGTGDYSFTMSNAMSGATDYIASVTSGGTGGAAGDDTYGGIGDSTPTTTVLKHYVRDSGGSRKDSEFTTVLITGDLA
jgi:hypothetical protein